MITNNGGYSVTIDGEWAVVGNPTICTIYIYKLDYQTMLWGDGQPHSTKVKNCNDSRSRDFGASISISGALLAVGAPAYYVTDISGNILTDAGRAYVLKWDDPNPGLNIVSWADGEAAGDQFGFSVTTNNPSFLVGAPGADSIYNSDPDVGAAYLYTIVLGSIALPIQTITIPSTDPRFTPVRGDHLGFELSLSDSLMLLSGEKSYIFQKGTGVWAPVFELTGTGGGDVSQTNGDAPPVDTTCGAGTAGEECGVLGKYGANWEVWGQDGSDYTSGNSSRHIPAGGTIEQANNSINATGYI